MKFRRRQFLQLAGAAAALPAVSRIAWADTYPSRPVRIVVGFPPGSATDTDMRLIAAPLGQKLGQEFIVENKPGAGSNLAAEIVSRAAPDGYTLLAMTVTNAVNATLYQELSFDIQKDIAPVIGTFESPNLLVVNSVGAGQDACRIHRLRQGQSGQDQLRLVRHRQRAQHERRIAQADGRHQSGARALSAEPGAGSAQRTGAGVHRARCP